MKDLFFTSLVVINIALPLILSSYFYIIRKFRSSKETYYAIAVLLLLAYRNVWIFFKYIYEVNNEFILKITALSFCFLLLFASLWIDATFPVYNQTPRFKTLSKGLYKFSFGFALMLMPLSVLLQPDYVRNDVNLILAMLFGILQIILLFQIPLRVSHLWRKVPFEIKYYNGVLFLGTILIIFSNVLFVWLDQAILHQVAPMIGYIIVLFSLTTARVFPLSQFVTTINAGIVLVNQNHDLIYINAKARQYIDPVSLQEEKSIKLDNLWSDQNDFILTTFDSVVQNLKAIQVEGRFFNYTTNTLENIRLTFYPLGVPNILSNRPQIGIMISHSDELEFLKQRKDFLFDVATHDIANVCQTLNISCESLSRKDFISENAYEIFQLAKRQSDRLTQLVLSIQNLLEIDEISSSPSEYYSDFNKRFNDLIAEKLQKFPEFKIIKEGLSELRPIKTTGNLKAGFSLLLDSIFETSILNTIKISTIINDAKLQQQIIFQFNGKELSETLLESYTNERKTDLTTKGSSARVNLIVSGSIIQKNAGSLRIEDFNKEKNLKKIVVTLPIFFPIGTLRT